MGYRYNWQEGSAIRQIEVAKNPSARVEATIYAPDSIDDKVANLPQYLTKHDFICYLDEVEGHNVVKVVDFGKKEDRLLDTLKSGGFLSGNSTQIPIADSSVKLSTLAKIRKNGLNISGVFGDMGHAALAVSGIVEGDKNRVATAGLYGASATISALFGTGAGAIRFTEMVSDMRDYLSEKGFNLTDPLIVTPEMKFRQRNVLARTYDYVKTHPIQISQGISLIGNISLLQSGYREVRAEKTGTGRLFAGVVTSISALIAMFMPESTPEEIAEYKKEKGVFKRLREGDVGGAIKSIPHRAHMFIARSPLAFQGALLLTDNMGMLFDATQNARKYEVWEKGGNAPPTLTATIKGLFRGKKAEGKYQPSHKEAIKNINAELQTLQSRAALSNPNTEEAKKAAMKASALVKRRDKMEIQINGLKRKGFGKAAGWITALTYTTASAFNTLATKNRDVSLEGRAVYQELYTYAANAILDLPEQVQSEVIMRMAFYLSTKPDVHVSEKEIAEGVAAKLAVLKKSPWMNAMVEIEEEAATNPTKYGVNNQQGATIHEPGRSEGTPAFAEYARQQTAKPPGTKLSDSFVENPQGQAQSNAPFLCNITSY